MRAGAFFSVEAGLLVVGRVAVFVVVLGFCGDGALGDALAEVI